MVLLLFWAFMTKTSMVLGITNLELVEKPRISEEFERDFCDIGLVTLAAVIDFVFYGH